MTLNALLFITCFFIAFLWNSLHRQKMRRLTMAEVAKRVNLDFTEYDEFDLHNELRMFKLIKWRPFIDVITRLGIKNVISGILEGSEVFLFDYDYKRYSSRIGNICAQTVFVALLEDVKLPNFRYQGKYWYQYALISRHNKPGNPGQIEFRENLVKWDETEEQAQKQLIPELQFFLSADEDTQIEVIDGRLLIYKPGVLMSTDNAVDFFGKCCALTALLQDRETRKSVIRRAEIKGKDY